MNWTYRILFFLFGLNLYGQYHTQHYIAPAPWQYWNDANEIVIGTTENNVPVNVELRKSDGTLITNLIVTGNNPISYRFQGSFTSTPRNNINTVYQDRGLFITASHPILVNMRNIASDALSSSNATIKGNASLVSFGNEGLGTDFRVGYYRTSTAGLESGAPIYSIMATEDNTEITFFNQNITLNQGESYLFKAPVGTLVTSNKLVVMNVGSYGDTPQTCGANGEDGTFDQIAPVNSLGTKYMVIRGQGTVPTSNQQALGYGSEQTTIVSTEPNTTITITHFNADGTSFQIPILENLTIAGATFSFYHGNGLNQFSSSLIESNKPIVVYSGTAVDCETDISTVLPIGGCAGALNIQTKKFIDYNTNNLPYFGFCIIESATIPILLNGQNVETLTGNARIQISNTGLYLITFDNININNPTNIILTSTLPITSSLVQQGSGFSMSAFFSSFGPRAEQPIIANINNDCSITLEAESGFSNYIWFLNGEVIESTTQNFIIITEPGNYSVQTLSECGLSGISIPLNIELIPCSDLEIKKEVINQEDLNVTFLLTAKNLNPNFTEPNAIVSDMLPVGYTFVSYEATSGTFNNNSGIWNIGTLEPNQVETLKINCVINDQKEYINTATITGSLTDSNLSNNTDNATISLNIADIDAFKNDFQDFYEAGKDLNYTIKVINNGPQKAFFVLVEDLMPHQTTEMSWSGNGRTGTGNLIDTIDVLNVNEEVVYNVKLKVPSDHVSEFTNSVTISSDLIDDPNSNCSQCFDTNYPEFKIPKGISPNGDGKNDFLDLSDYFISNLSIFNRYGKKVFSKENYINEWYGQDSNNKPLPSGTYFYEIKVLNTHYKTGYIQLLREVK